jgi:ribonuclease BN (tRNA processing enzyme)
MRAIFWISRKGARPTTSTSLYSYRFDTQGRVVVFTGDTGPSEGADVLITEVVLSDDLVAQAQQSFSVDDPSRARGQRP